ncbi:bifunctional 50S ribosomal protein L30e-like/Ribosomal protein L7Ae-L30e-S12e-Gadd45/Ribosomal protein L7Ae-L8-Nhp2 family [Babesia duncani]|uniref:Bifunctional 50S ribosomal protein L30e-like/Ribosomal protein L7Ae-L30e-S12e-Gadd45/Ribosomal protein L7Ae-L8-Nhp2 family n=1 Tax=Babesia duncani TaxID=323732 RepID=A0AAD9PNF6_9APIC|nr:bifunctional 50S ribosomal protein L30e-like/Ribosomal protein L7Ae-L30e-S12e-Gadd45/Ribosomal protein L7Ae-L8-Nhp2 family [Babesia duncani]
MGDEEIEYIEQDDDSCPLFISPIADPRLDGKALSRSLKLLKRALSLETLAKRHKMEDTSFNDLVLTRLVKRGVQDVTKAIRKGVVGIVLIACDVHPVDVVAHLPILCEEHSIAYAYTNSKRELSDVCKSKRPTCVVLVVKPPNDFEQRISKVAADKLEKLDYRPLFQKVDTLIRECHPYL